MKEIINEQFVEAIMDTPEWRSLNEGQFSRVPEIVAKRQKKKKDKTMSPEDEIRAEAKKRGVLPHQRPGKSGGKKMAPRKKKPAASKKPEATKKPAAKKGEKPFPDVPVVKPKKWYKDKGIEKPTVGKRIATGGIPGRRFVKKRELVTGVLPWTIAQAKETAKWATPHKQG